MNSRNGASIITRSILAITAAFFGVRANRVTGGDHLSDFMHGGAHIDAVGFRGEPVRQQRVHRRVEEDSDSTEDNHCRHGDRHFTGFGFDDRLGGRDRRGAADAATGADKPAGMFIEPENLLPEETGDKEGAGQRQYVNQDPADADVSNLGKRQTKTIKNDPRAQQILLGEKSPRRRRTAKFLG